MFHSREHIKGVRFLSELSGLAYIYKEFVFYLILKDYHTLHAVVWIRDILVRIRIRGSVQTEPDSDPDPAIFVSDLQDSNKKIFSTFFCLLLFEAIFSSFFEYKKS